MKISQDKIRGCLIGGAVGDALGYPVKTMSYEKIVKTHGSQGITRYQLDQNGIAEISDATQMTLFTANGLLINDIPAAYQEWRHTQTGSYPGSGDAKCWLSNVPELYSRRSLSRTRMSALKHIEKGQPKPSDSKGCGGIMRVAPIGIYGAVHGLPLEETASMACEAARLTNGHPLGWIPAGEFAVLVQQLIEEDIQSAEVYEDYIGDMLASASLAVREEAEREGEQVLDYFYYLVYDCSAKLLDTAHSEISQPDHKNIQDRGKGWISYETWNMALYCMLKYLHNFEDAVIASVNHSGNSASVGSVVGNIMGAIVGYEAIPACFKQNLELHDHIIKMADRLYAG